MYHLERKITQKQKLIELFRRNPNQWISLKKILELGIAQYNTRIKEIKEDEKNPMKIINQCKRIGGQTYSDFMYVTQKIESNGQIAFM